MKDISGGAKPQKNGGETPFAEASRRAPVVDDGPYEKSCKSG
jgi:hypothetical protein